MGICGAKTWKLLRWSWLFSTGGVAVTTIALVLIYFTPVPTYAAALTDTLTVINDTATAVEVMAEGSIVKMLLIALILSLVTQAGCVVALFKLLFKAAGSPVFIQTDMGKGVVRDTLRECWKDVRNEYTGV